MQSQRAAAALLAQGESANTRRSYQAAWRYWEAWFGARYGGRLALPLPGPVVVQFILDHALREAGNALVLEMPAAVRAQLQSQGLGPRNGQAPALATLQHRLNVMAKLHRQFLAQHAAQGKAEAAPQNPLHTEPVRALMRSVRRAYAKRGDAPARKPALTKEPMRALLATCDDSLIGLRDRALLLFAWTTGGRRRSEVALARLAQLQPTGPAQYVYDLRHSKTNQAGVRRGDEFKPVVGEAGQALHDWLVRAGITDGTLFRQVRKGGSLSGPLSGAAVREIVRKRCALAGLSEEFSAHSLRSGFVTEAGLQGAPLAHAMALSGHASLTSFAGYYRQGEGQRLAMDFDMGQD